MIGTEVDFDTIGRPVTWAPVALEMEILSVMDRRPEPGERLEFAFRRKELELMSVFDRLSLLDARELHRRLTLTLADDPIAKTFVRLVPERRQRLLAFLRDARRRAAICGTSANVCSGSARR